MQSPSPDSYRQLLRGLLLLVAPWIASMSAHLAIGWGALSWLDTLSWPQPAAGQGVQTVFISARGDSADPDAARGAEHADGTLDESESEEQATDDPLMAAEDQRADNISLAAQPFARFDEPPPSVIGLHLFNRDADERAIVPTALTAVVEDASEVDDSSESDQQQPQTTSPATSKKNSGESAAKPSRGLVELPAGHARTGISGANGEGRKFVYVFDRSGSMSSHGGAPLRAAKAELLNSLQDLGQTHQFQIIFYNERPRIFNPSGVAGRLVFGTDQNKRLAEKFVGSVTADGATRHEEALETALRMSPDVVFFLTDADDPKLTAEQLARVRRLNRGATIQTIEFGNGPQADPDNFLVRLAKENGGSHVYVDVSRLPK